MTDMEKIARLFAEQVIGCRMPEGRCPFEPEETCTCRSDFEATVRQITAAGYAIVPVEVNSALMKAWVDQWETPGFGLKPLWAALLSAGAIRPEESSNGN